MKEPALFPPPERGERVRVGVIICSVISNRYHPPPQPPPLSGRGILEPRYMAIFPKHDTIGYILQG
jgi:streptomycin 6-kinase